VQLLQIDTSSKESITHAANEIKQNYNGQLDVVINNAAITLTDDSVQSAQETFATNYYGIKLLNEHLVPLLRDNGRIVNVASEAGSMVLGCVSKDLQDKHSSPSLTAEQLDQLVEDFVSALESNNFEKAGYPTDINRLAYPVSKAAVIALTRIEAHQNFDGKKVFIYSTCPGYCSTDLNDHASGTRSPELGADSILYAVNTPDRELKNGAFYQDGKELSQICDDEAKVHQFRDIMKQLYGAK
jgi:carbonyl reductase 1